MISRPTSPLSDEKEGENSWLGLVKQKASNLHYGSILITIHNGKVMQIEATEKLRFSEKNQPTEP